MSLNSSRRSAQSYGDDVYHAFKPYISKRLVTSNMSLPQPVTVEELLNGRDYDPAQIKLCNKSNFVSGGFSRGTALRGMTVVGDEVKMTGQSSLGPGFEEFLRSYNQNDLTEIVNDFNHGVDITRSSDMQLDFLLKTRPEDPAKLEALRCRVPKVRNSETVDTHALFVAKKVTEMIANGGIRHIGTVDETAERGNMPLCIGSFTVEPNKPRLCTNCKTLNKGTQKRLGPPLQGIPDIRRYVTMHKDENIHGGVVDEMSAYLNTKLAPESEEFFGMIIFDHVFVYTHPPFGYTNSCQLHQRNGGMYNAYFCSLGFYASRYIDDCCVISIGDEAKCQRALTAFLLIAGYHGGIYFGADKCVLKPSRRWEILGLIVDTVNMCFRIPEAKKQQLQDLCRQIISGLEQDRPVVNLYSLARHAGKCVYYAQAIALLSVLQNMTYCCLANNGNFDQSSASTDNNKRKLLWWEIPAGTAENLRMSKENARQLAEELRMCCHIVKEDRSWPFVDDRHKAVVVHYSDSTPKQSGNVSVLPQSAQLPDGWGEREICFGSVLADEMDLPYATSTDTMADLIAGLLPKTLKIDGNIGISEGAALILGLMTIDNHEVLRQQYVNKRVDFHIDNMEMMWLFKRRRVKKGDHRMEKITLLRCLLHFEFKFNMLTQFHYVNTLDNPADLPSRVKINDEQRLDPAVKRLLWVDPGPFDLDWMGTHASAMTNDEGERIDYYSRGFDPYSVGMNVLANAVSYRNGQRTKGYCYPPFNMLNTIIGYVFTERADVTIVHPRIEEPRLPWAQYLRGYPQVQLPKRSAQKRTNQGWEGMEISLEYTVVSFLAPDCGV